MNRLLAFFRQLVRAMKTLARDQRIPKPLRWIAGLALLPIPGPFDEAVLLLIAPLFLLYREPLREAWRAAALTPSPPSRSSARRRSRAPRRRP